MLFKTDKQTQEDLNIYGKQGTDSILSLFNRTSTLNGARILEEMFNYPLSDAEAINKRSGAIGYLRVVQAVFPFSSELFDRAEQYLANTDERSKLSAERRSLEKKLASLIADNTDYKQIVNGISALLEIIKVLDSLLKNNLVQAGSPFKSDPETISIGTLLIAEPISLLLQEDSRGKFSRKKLATYDMLLRFRHRETIQRILRYIYQLDVYMTVAKVATERNFIFPKALPKGEHVIKIEGFYHPQLKHAVPNTLDVTSDNNVVFLTGANMAGKSTFMKSLGIAIYLAHMGFPVAAKKLEFSVLDGIYTTINLPDNLGIGASHFYAEVLRIKKMAKELSAGKNIFVIFDELFRGTNVKDAYEATIAITSAFAIKRNSVFVISTHIIEAGAILKERCANISFKYLPTRMKGTIPEYTYTLETGITDDRHGMIIINNEGILELLKKWKGNRPMGFIADKQTLEDLNLLGKYTKHSIFSLFNKVSTAGGEKLLGEMFQTPLTDPEAINTRSAIFKYFQSKQLTFPFTNKQFSIVDNYLSGSGGKLYLTALITLGKKKLLSAIIRDEEYQNIQSSLQQTITLLKDCKAFISQLSNDKAYPFYNELLAVKNILDDPKLEWLSAEQTGQLSLTKMAGYDHLLRHTMRAALTTVIETFYQLDVYITVANLAQAKGFYYANALPKEANLFIATALSHPGIERAVANPVSFHQNSNMIFLTGANMAGKSTFMKAFGINVYLAHMGFPVAAEQMEFSVTDGIYSSINVPDNLNMGYSHFYAEVLRVKNVAEQVSSGKSLVIIFDELFKGTNVKDAYDATLAVTAAFSEYSNCLFIISAHIIEAGEVLKKQSNIQMVYLPTIMNGSIPKYTYQLQPGISSDRHGMTIIENEGILDIISSAAR